MSEINNPTNNSTSSGKGEPNLNTSTHHRSPYSSFYYEFENQSKKEDDKILYPSQQEANYPHTQTQNLSPSSRTIAYPHAEGTSSLLQNIPSNQFVYTMLSSRSSKDHIISSPAVEVVTAATTPPENIYLGINPKMTQEQLVRIARFKTIYERLVRNDRTLLPPQFQQSFFITQMGTNVIYLVWIFSFLMIGGRSASEPKLMLRNFLKFSFVCFFPYMMVRSMMSYTLSKSFDYSYRGRTYEEIENQLSEIKQTTPILRY